MRFSVDFFKAIYDGSAPTESLVMSPMSVYSALMLTYFGANGQTEEQIGNLLGFHNTTKVLSFDVTLEGRISYCSSGSCRSEPFRRTSWSSSRAS